MASSDSVPDPDEARVKLLDGLGLDSEPSHLIEALTHPSYANERPDARTDNQRLEFLGDAVIGLCVSELLMDYFEDVDEGVLTVMRSALVNAQALADAGRGIGLADALLLGRGADAGGERHRTSVLADGLEAVVGAVFLDVGLDGARGVCQRVLGDAVATLVASGGTERDAKSRLQEALQAEGMPPPHYEVVASEGPDHAREFTVRVSIEVASGAADAAPVDGVGKGRSKKLAEQAAARTVLAILRARR